MQFKTYINPLSALGLQGMQRNKARAKHNMGQIQKSISQGGYKMYKLKITCYTPKGQSEKASNSFGIKYFDVFHKPMETKIISESEFYYIYEYEKEKDMHKIIAKIPKAEASVRNFYFIIIPLVERARKLSDKLSWPIEKARRWIMRQLNKKCHDPKEMEEFIREVDLNGKEEMLLFLAGDLFKYEILTEDVK